MKPTFKVSKKINRMRAFQLSKEMLKEEIVYEFENYSVYPSPENNEKFIVETKGGQIEADIYDYVIVEEGAGLYSCNEDEFKKIYNTDNNNFDIFLEQSIFLDQPLDAGKEEAMLQAEMILADFVPEMGKGNTKWS